MNKQVPLLVLVTGRPATGKTYLANLLSATFNLPVISKDAIKEILFDTMGSGDRTWSKKLGKSSFSLMDYMLESELKAGRSCILESPINPDFENKKFQGLQAKYNFSAVQIICDGDNDVLFERFKQRAESGQRHPGHGDNENLEEFKEAFSKDPGEQRIEIESSIFEIDTTDFSMVDYQPVILTIRGYLDN